MQKWRPTKGKFRPTTSLPCFQWLARVGSVIPPDTLTSGTGERDHALDKMNSFVDSWKIPCPVRQSVLLNLDGLEFGALRQGLFQHEIGCFCRELLRVEVLSGSLSHLSVLLVSRLDEDLYQVRVAIGTSGVLWRACPRSV
jgi:hypothetical protein